MNNNDIIRTLTEIFEFDTTQLLNVFAQASHPVTREYATGLVAKKSRSTYQECNEADLLAFLNGLISIHRGPSSNSDEQPTPVNNNTILKKLRVALKLQEENLLSIFANGNIKLTKNELTPLFRNDKHKHYRPCSEKQFKGFLAGLKQYVSASKV